MTPGMLDVRKELRMEDRKKLFGLVILILSLTGGAFAEDYGLQYFLAKTSSSAIEVSVKERTELLNGMGEMITKVQQIHSKLIQTIQDGGTDIRYQEGKFWMSKLEVDQRSIENVNEQLKLLYENPVQLAPSIILYKSLRDLSSNFNAYNNMPSFCALVGDLAPEIELWADPVFYRLYLLPLAQLKNTEKAPPPKEKKPIPKGKKP
jgi:hypothetical protein